MKVTENSLFSCSWLQSQRDMLKMHVCFFLTESGFHWTKVMHEKRIFNKQVEKEHQNSTKLKNKEQSGIISW